MEKDYIKQGDCLELMKEIPDGSIDFVLIDPPYEKVSKKLKEGTDTYGGAFGRRKSLHEISTLSEGITTEILDELVRIMKKINICIWCNKTQLRQYINYFEDRKCVTDLLTWHKTNPVPTCNNTYLSDTEYLLFFREKGVSMYGSYATKKKFYVTTTNKADKTKYGHPTIKPLDITENLILNHTKEGDVVLDCYMGSGTTAVASINTGRHYIGFELEPKYLEIAQKRIEEAKMVAV